VPPVVAAITAAVTAMAANITVAAIGSFLVKTAISIGFQMIIGALSKKPTAPSAASFGATAADRTVTVRQPTSDWPIIYGTVRTGGVLTFISASGSSNEFINLVITLAGHQVSAIGTMYFDAVAVPVDGAGDATGTYADHVHIQKNLGTPDQAALADLTAEDAAWTSSHRQRGRAGVYVRLKYNTDVFPNGVPNITFDVSGRIVYDPRDVAVNITSSAAGGAGLATITSAAAHGLSAGERVFIRDHSGADPDLAGEYYVQAVADTTHYDIFIGDGVTVSTGGTGGNGTLMVFSANSALAAADYLLAKDFGLGADYDAEIDDTMLVESANICDEAVALDAGGTEDRYATNGTFKTDEKPSDIIGNLNTAMAGRVAFIGGKWFVFAGSYRTPTITFDEGDLRDAGPLRVLTTISRRESFNAVKGVYVSADAKWQPTDYPAVTNATYLAADQGERVWKDLDLPYTTSAPMAQRLAKIDLERVRQEITIPEMKLKLAAYTVQSMDVVNIDNTRLGWSGKPFEVVSSTLVLEEDGAGNPLLGVNLSLRETASAVFTWSAEETAVDAAPNTNLPDPSTVAPPTALALTSGTSVLDIRQDGTIFSRIKAAWTAPADELVTAGGRVQLRYKKSAAATWIYQATIPGAVTEAYILDVQDGVAYDVEVRGVNGLGVRSDKDATDPWQASVTSHTVVGKSEPPADVSSFAIDAATLSWVGPESELDLAGYHIRFHYGVNHDWSTAAALHTGILAASPYTMGVVPPGPVTLLIKAIDTSSNPSANAAAIVTDLGDPAVANVVESWAQAPTWTGSLTNGAIDSGAIKADQVGIAMWTADGNLMWSADGTLLWATVAYEAMSYECSFTPSLAASGSALTIEFTATGGGHNLEYRKADTVLWSGTDTALMWTGSSAIMWTVRAYLPWPGSIVATNELIEVRASTLAGTAQGVFSELTPQVDLPDLFETLADVVLASGGTRLAPTETFTAIVAVTLTLQDDGGSAKSAIVKDKNVALGPLCQALDAAGSGTGGTVDARVQGY
jgi:hypothetical protein